MRAGIPSGLADWAWQTAGHLLVPPPAVSSTPQPGANDAPVPLASLLGAIAAVQAGATSDPSGSALDQGHAAALAPLALALLSRVPSASEDEQLRRAADALRQELAGDTVTYVVNRNLNVSNHCIKHCSFCAFRRDAGEPGAYWLSEAELEQRAAEAQEAGATELCIQGG